MCRIDDPPDLFPRAIIFTRNNTLLRSHDENLAFHSILENDFVFPEPCAWFSCIRLPALFMRYPMISLVQLYAFIAPCLSFNTSSAFAFFASFRAFRVPNPLVSLRSLRVPNPFPCLIYSYYLARFHTIICFLTMINVRTFKRSNLQTYNTPHIWPPLTSPPPAVHLNFFVPRAKQIPSTFP